MSINSDQHIYTEYHGPKKTCPKNGVHTKDSPFFQVNSEEDDRVREAGKKHPELEKLTRAIYLSKKPFFHVPIENQLSSAHDITQKVEDAAKQLFFKHLEPFKEYRCTAEDLIKWVPEDEWTAPQELGHTTLTRSQVSMKNWQVTALVPEVKNARDVIDSPTAYYVISPWQTARHELDHVRLSSPNEPPRSMLTKDYTKSSRILLELLPATQDVIDADTIYRKIYKIPEGSPSNYLEPRCIEIGGGNGIEVAEFTDFYRKLTKEHDNNLSRALVSEKSIDYLRHHFSAVCPPKAPSEMMEIAALLRLVLVPLACILLPFFLVFRKRRD